MTNTNNGAELDLPRELVLRIFEDGARAHAELAHSLCLVSRWTCILALPELYDTVVLKTIYQKIGFLRAIEKGTMIPMTWEDRGDGPIGGGDLDLNASHKRFLLKDLVKCIWLEPMLNWTLDIFRLCDRITHIALPLVNLLWLVDSSTAGRGIGQSRVLGRDAFANKQNLQLLLFGGDESGISSTSWTLRTYIDAQHPERTSPLFSMVSHFRLAGFNGGLSPDDPLQLSHFTNLSHLAISLRNSDELVQVSATSIDPTTGPSINPVLGEILEHPPLTHLVLIMYTDVEFAFASPDRQKATQTLEGFQSLRPRYRKLYLVTMEFSHLQRDWEMEMRGGMTFWERAEEFTASLELTS